jgi:hypothetical protein
MNAVSKLLVLTAFAGVMGSAQAQTDGQTFDLGTLSTNVQQQTDFFASGSFLDTFNFTIDAAHQMFTGSAVAFSPTGVDATQTHVTDLQFQLFDSTGSLLFTGVNLQSALTPGDFSLKVSGIADGPVGGGFELSVAANPEPAEWMLLLAGLMVAGFIARRKIDLVTG